MSGRSTDSLPSHLWARAVRSTAAWWAGSRLVLTVAGWAAVGALRQHPRQSWPASLYEFWGRWDSGWYLDIADHGYSCATKLAPGVEGQANVAFFPLYPTVARFFGEVMGGHPFGAGIVLSNLALVMAGLLLFQMVAAQYDVATAGRALAFLFVFPTSFYFSAFLTEGVYLALVVACFWAAYHHRCWTAWFVAAACAISRPPGILILVPIVYEYMSARRWSFKAVGLDGAGIVLPILALGAHLVFLHRLTNDAFAFIHVQSAWHRRPGDPLSTLVHGLRDDTWPALYACSILGVLLWGCRAMRPSERLFAAYSILVPLSTSVMCMPRLCSTIFPLWIICARRTSVQRTFRASAAGLALAQVVLFVLWVNGFGELC